MGSKNREKKKVPIWEVLTCIATILGVTSSIYFYYDGKASTENKIVEALSERYENVDKEMSYERALETVDREIVKLQNANSALQSDNIELQHKVDSLQNEVDSYIRVSDSETEKSPSGNDSTEGTEIFNQLLEAQRLYLAKDYNAAKVIYQNIFEKSSRAKLNLGYLYAHGYGVEQDTVKASQYYKAAYEDGNSLGLQNYISINLTMPSSYEDTLEALKYGFENNNKTAISYLSICFCGELRDVSDVERKKMANIFMALEPDEQIEKLSAKKEYYLREIIYCDKDERLIDTEFTEYTSYENKIQHTVKKEVYCYITEPSKISEDEKRIVPVYATGQKIPYLKTSYHFYMSEYFELDKFDSI